MALLYLMLGTLLLNQRTDSKPWAVLIFFVAAVGIATGFVMALGAVWK